MFSSIAEETSISQMEREGSVAFLGTGVAGHCLFVLRGRKDVTMEALVARPTFCPYQMDNNKQAITHLIDRKGGGKCWKIYLFATPEAIHCCNHVQPLPRRNDYVSVPMLARPFEHLCTIATRLVGFVPLASPASIATIVSAGDNSEAHTSL